MNSESVIQTAFYNATNHTNLNDIVDKVRESLTTLDNTQSLLQLILLMQSCVIDTHYVFIFPGI